MTELERDDTPIEKLIHRTWRILAGVKVIWCDLSGRHEPKPLLGCEMWFGNDREHAMPIPEGLGTICENCAVFTLYTGAHLYGRLKATSTERDNNS